VCGQPLPQPAAGVISPVVLRLSFPAGNVEIPAGTSLVLGRDPEESLVAAAFADYDNVSRRHATVTVSDSGNATIRDERSTNGTSSTATGCCREPRRGSLTGTASGWPAT